MFAPGLPIQCLKLAEWRERFLAALLDAVIVGIPLFLLLSATALTTATRSRTGEHLVHVPIGPFVITYVLGLLLVLVYFGLLDGCGSGQTVGKRVMRIATCDSRNGGLIGFKRAYFRAFVCLLLWNIYVIPGIVDALWPLRSKHRQALHDFAASSVVIKLGGEGR